MTTGSGSSSVSSAPPASPVTTVEVKTTRGGVASVRQALSSARVPSTLTVQTFAALRWEAISAARCRTASGAASATAATSVTGSARSPATARVPAGSLPGRRTSATTS